MEDTSNTELVRSHVDTIILKTLQSKDSYPYEILREIEDLSSGKYVLKQATLYSCMKRLEKLGYINSYWGTESEGGRRRYYSLSDLGKNFLDKDKAEWEFSRTLINRLLSDKDVDLDTITPPFDASALRPLTKRTIAKTEDSGSSLSDENLDQQTSQTENDNLPLKKNIMPSSAFLEEADKKPTSTDKIPMDIFVKKDAANDVADEHKKTENADKTETSNFESTNLAKENDCYYTKDPIFQHTLPEEDRNFTSKFDFSKRSTEESFPIREEETETMKAAAVLLQIGKKYKDEQQTTDGEKNFSKSVVYNSAKLEEKSQGKASRAENYRDVLTRIFSEQEKNSVTKTENDVSEKSNVEPLNAEPLRGRHLKDLQDSLEKQGYSLKIYSPKNRSDYYYNKYIYQNKINLSTNLIMFVIMVVEFIVIASLNSLLGFHAITLALSGVAIALPPIFIFVIYLGNPSKRIKSSYNVIQALIYRSILCLLIVAIEVIVCLLTPTFGIGFCDARMYIPWAFAFNLPMYAVIYNLLFRSKRFHLTCAKF